MAIKAVLKYEKIKLNENKVLLSSLIKACKLQNDCIRTQLPIRKGLLQVIINSVEKYYDNNPQPYLCTMFRALFSMAYFGLFRIGELTLSPHVIKARDIHIGVNKKKLLFVLHSSKTHNKSSKPQIIKIDSIKKYDVNCTNISVMQNCPFQLLQEYISRRRKYRCDSEQFFIMKDGSPVTQWHFRNMLDKLLRLNNFDASLYSSKAFRAGRASDLLSMGVSVETIRKLGRWRSSAVYTYLRT